MTLRITTESATAIPTATKEVGRVVCTVGTTVLLAFGEAARAIAYREKQPLEIVAHDEAMRLVDGRLAHLVRSATPA